MLEIIPARSGEEDQVEALYRELVAQYETTTYSPLWVMGEHPSREQIEKGVAAGNFFVCSLADKL